MVHERTFVRQSVGKSADQKFITQSYAIPVALVESWNFHTVLPARNFFLIVVYSKVTVHKRPGIIR